MTNLSRSDVLLDVCTQRDYLAPDGARRVLNASAALYNIKRLMVWARWAKLPIISTVDEVRPCDALGLPRPACVLGTPGQRKVAYTLMPDRVEVLSDNCLCVALDILKHHQQAILCKRHRDPLTNPKLDRLITEMPAKRFVVFGVSLDSCIRPLVLGILLRGRKVALIADGCGYFHAAEADFCLRQIAAKGCTVLSTDEYIASSLASRSRRQKGRFKPRRFVA